MVVSFGHDAEGHERLLNGVELDKQKAAGRVLLVSGCGGCSVLRLATFKAAVNSWLRMAAIEQADRKLLDPLCASGGLFKRADLRPLLAQTTCRSQLGGSGRKR